MVDDITETAVTTTDRTRESIKQGSYLLEGRDMGEPREETIMDTRAALGAAAALALTVTGGVSALFLTVGQASGTSPENTGTDAAVTVEYVDQYGNPVAPPSLSNAATTPEVILVNPDGTVVGQEPAAATTPAYGAEYEEEEYEDEEEYEEGEYEEAEHEEDEDDAEYAAGGHIEDDDEHEEGEHD